MIPKSCPGHKTGRIPALLPVNIFWFSIIGAKLKAEKHALWAALRSAACGGALRRCAAPSAAARRFAPPLRGATRPARCARRPFANTKKMPNFCPPLDLADPGASCSTVARPARPMVRTPCSWRFTRWLARSMPQHVPGSASQPFWCPGLRVAGACAPWNARAERQ